MTLTQHGLMEENGQGSTNLPIVSWESFVIITQTINPIDVQKRRVNVLALHASKS